jgi:NCAIR mutase (PurE)-related protein
MKKEDIRKLLEAYRDQMIGEDEILDRLASASVDDLGYARIDNGREHRTGIPEVIFAEGKTPEQVSEIAAKMNERGIPILATRASEEIFEAVKKRVPGAVYHKEARVMMHQTVNREPGEAYIAVVSAGTSDIPVAEEAALTAEFLGNRVERLFDVGVSGIHRLFDKLQLIRGARVVIVVAGMEGALASVVGGLVDRPVIGVPTSIGYGANFKGVSALLAMLNSCANGVSIVNIDNGFGAACQASLINHL